MRSMIWIEVVTVTVLLMAFGALNRPSSAFGGRVWHACGGWLVCVVCLWCMVG